MNESTQKYLTADFDKNSKHYAFARILIERFGDRLSESVNFSPACMFWVYVKTREDLQVLMELAPKWSKRNGVAFIEYTAEAEGIEVALKASGAALPGTCKLVEEEYEVPAVPAQPEIPATKAVRMVLKCDQPEGAQ